MDIFWVFILIFGIIVSIGQKASKKQTLTKNCCKAQGIGACVCQRRKAKAYLCEC